MHDLFAPASLALLTALLFAAVATWHILARAYRHERETARRCHALLAEGTAYALERRQAADAYRAGVEATIPALVAAGWRQPRAPVAVPVVGATTLRCGPPAPLDEWPDLPAIPPPSRVDALTELDEPAESGVRRPTMLPPKPTGVSPLAHSLPQIPVGLEGAPPTPPTTPMSP